jgi:hypothetical protein
LGSCCPAFLPSSLDLDLLAFSVLHKIMSLNRYDEIPSFIRFIAVSVIIFLPVKSCCGMEEGWEDEKLSSLDKC